MAITILVIASFNFFLLQVLPGDPTRVILPRGGGSCNGNTSQIGGGSCGLRLELTQQWGLDKPLVQRYLIYMDNLLHGNFGTSITVREGVPVLQVIAPTLATTLFLIGVATVLTMLLGLLLGRIAGWRRGSKLDMLITLVTLGSYSTPSYFTCLVLIFAFAFIFPVFPLLPQYSPDPIQNAFNTLDFDVLPITAYIAMNLAWFSLTMRNSLTDVLPEDYMVTAAAKGLSERQQLKSHALPNARLPVVTASALYFGWVVSGSVVIEQVFGINGLGRLTWTATKKLDYPLLGAILLIATVGVVAANAVADVLYMYLDPRVREA